MTDLITMKLCTVDFIGKDICRAKFDIEHINEDHSWMDEIHGLPFFTNLFLDQAMDGNGRADFKDRIVKRLVSG